jgi:hypothetical protein
MDWDRSPNETLDIIIACMSSPASLAGCHEEKLFEYPVFQHLKLQYDEPLTNFAINLNLRRYNEGACCRSAAQNRWRPCWTLAGHDTFIVFRFQRLMEINVYAS